MTTVFALFATILPGIKHQDQHGLGQCELIDVGIKQSLEHGAVVIEPLGHDKLGTRQNRRPQRHDAIVTDASDAIQLAVA